MRERESVCVREREREHLTRFLFFYLYDELLYIEVRNDERETCQVQ